MTTTTTIKIKFVRTTIRVCFINSFMMDSECKEIVLDSFNTPNKASVYEFVEERANAEEFDDYSILSISSEKMAIEKTATILGYNIENLNIITN